MTYYRGYNSGFGGSAMTESVKTILIINVSVFLASIFARWFPWGYVVLRPVLIVHKFMVWQAITYMFIHFEMWHLVINMLMLWFFGPALEDAWGSKRFMTYYLICGVGGALGAFLFSFNAATIGASGAIFGLLVAYAMMFPETVVLVFFFFPMKIKHAVLVFAAINLLGAVSASGSGVSYVAHLGGALFGYIYLKSETIKFFIKRSGLIAKSNKRSSRPKSSPRSGPDDKKVDEILDKIAKHGMNSLSKDEKKILEERSRRH
jgi:membrane associated rhomboid family serine protease